MSATQSCSCFRPRSLLNSQAFVILLTSCSAGTTLFLLNPSLNQTRRLWYYTNSAWPVWPAWFDLKASKFRLRYRMKPEIPSVVKQEELFDYSRTNSYNRRVPLDQFAIACTVKWRDLRYGTGSVSDLSIDQETS